MERAPCKRQGHVPSRFVWPAIPDMMSPSHLRRRLVLTRSRSAYGYSTQSIEDTCRDDDLQHKVAVLPCITNLWNNKECARRHINERCRMQGTPPVPLVSHTRPGVIDRRANFILGALYASSFLFPIGQRRPRGGLCSTRIRLFWPLFMLVQKQFF